MSVPVIAISGPPGSGKTRLAAALAARLRTPAVIEFDRYKSATERTPDEIAAWLAAGADYDALPLGALADDLARLKGGTPVRPPGGPPVAPGRAVIFDTLLGRAHAASGRLIDRLIWIDTPLDLALARKLGGMVAEADAGPGGEAAGLLAWLGDYLDFYAGFIRDTYLLQRARVRPAADILIDGLGDPAVTADRLAEELEAGLVGGWPGRAE